jgi:hypothetical protein
MSLARVQDVQREDSTDLWGELLVDAIVERSVR